MVYHNTLLHTVLNEICRQTSNISRILVGNEIVDHADVIEASSVSPAPTSSFSTWHLPSIDCTKLQDETMDIWDLARRISKVWPYLSTCNVPANQCTMAAYESLTHLYQTTLIAFIHRIVLGQSSVGNCHYNMGFSALFLQRALYTVHCTNIMHPRKPSFVITPAVVSFYCKLLFLLYICGNEMRKILLKQINRTSVHINTIKHPWLGPGYEEI